MNFQTTFTANGNSDSGNAQSTTAAYCIHSLGTPTPATGVQVSLQMRIGDTWTQIGTTLTGVTRNAVDVPVGIPLRLNIIASTYGSGVVAGAAF